MSLLIIAQNASTTTGRADAWWRLLIDNALALTILFIFVTAIISVLVNKHRKDKCLKRLGGYHISFLTTAGKVIWGNLVVYSQGIELRFDKPHMTRRALAKSSAMIYPEQLGNCLALGRVADGLSASERRSRLRQIRRSFRPGLIRQTFRWLRNIVNMLRDAFSKALTTIIGSLTKTRPGMVGGQQGQVTEIGKDPCWVLLPTPTSRFLRGTSASPWWCGWLGRRIVRLQYRSRCRGTWLTTPRATWRCSIQNMSRLNW